MTATVDIAWCNNVKCEWQGYKRQNKHEHRNSIFVRLFFFNFENQDKCKNVWPPVPPLPQNEQHLLQGSSAPWAPLEINTGCIYIFCYQILYFVVLLDNLLVNFYGFRYSTFQRVARWICWYFILDWSLSFNPKMLTLVCFIFMYTCTMLVQCHIYMI